MHTLVQNTLVHLVGRDGLIANALGMSERAWLRACRQSFAESVKRAPFYRQARKEAYRYVLDWRAYERQQIMRIG